MVYVIATQEQKGLYLQEWNKTMELWTTEWTEALHFRYHGDAVTEMRDVIHSRESGKKEGLEIRMYAEGKTRKPEKWIVKETDGHTGEWYLKGWDTNPEKRPAMPKMTTNWEIATTFPTREEAERVAKELMEQQQLHYETERLR